MSKRGASEPPKDADQPGRDSSRRTFPVHEHIGHQLKIMFDEVAAQPIPENIRKLLEELERKGL
jgi:hypothetical protein